ncbi:hypothetical protein J2I48_12405 [Fibrella sp. HMF5036]|uniref:histidine kinase n=2 Tax=Fibrella aquatilis TaxID=2817059 RepID=A0A939G7X4_9BACT|nr:hypothetical protein [Fibrella aquatilis]
MDGWLRKRTRLVNGISVVPALVYLGFVLCYTDEPHRVTFWECVPASILSCGPVVLNHYRRYTAACYFFVIFNLINYSYSSISHGEVDAAEYLLVTAGVLPMLFFRQFSTVFLLFLLHLICFFLCKYSFTVLKPLWVMPNGENLYYLNHFFMFSILFLNVYYFKSENTRQEEDLKRSLLELKATQNQLIQREKLASLGELTAGIAHEIQNPLNFVTNFSDISAELVAELEDEQQRPARDHNLEVELLGDLKQNLKKIAHHGGRASAIIKGMLEHANVSTGDRQATDLNKLADEYLHLAYHGQRLRHHSFSCQLVQHLDPGLLPIHVVPQDIGRVLLNLYHNAFYAVQEKQKTAPASYQPIITVSTTQTNKALEVRIHDNGTGMDDAVKAKIFQPFYTTKPTGEGTGLGLSLSYDIVTKGHNGTLAVNSVAGEFSEFCISLPLV